MNDMKIDGAGSCGTATIIHSQEEKPYEGKPIGADKSTDAHGMDLEGSSRPDNDSPADK